VSFNLGRGADLARLLGIDMQFYVGSLLEHSFCCLALGRVSRNSEPKLITGGSSEPI